MNPGANNQKEIYNSPLHSLNYLIIDKNKKKNIRLRNINMNSEDKNTLFNHRTSQNNFKNITKNDPKLKYKTFIHNKNTKSISICFMFNIKSHWNKSII